MSDVVKFKRKVVLLAEGKGLSISEDRLGKFYLVLDDAPDDGTLNPGIVLITSSLKEIEDYLHVHTGPHRALSPAEVLPEIMPLPPDAEDEDN